MTDSREKVLQNVRHALGRGALDEAARTRLSERLSRPPAPTRISFTDDPVERFVAKATGEAATVVTVSGEQDVPLAVAEFLASHNLAARVAAAPAMRAIEWPEHLDVDFGTTRGEHDAAVTPCLAAVAETGSVVLVSGEQTPTSLNFLPDNHIVVVKRSQVSRNFEDVWTRLRELGEALPRAVNLITGPSRTADIEQTMQFGAHGPRRVHIIVVQDA